MENIKSSALSRSKTGKRVLLFKNSFQGDLSPTAIFDGELILLDLNGRVISFLDKLCPNGLMNMRPNYSIRNMHVKGAPKVLGYGVGHHKFSVKKKGRTYSGVAFFLSQCHEKLICGTPLDIVIIDENEWRGNNTI